MKFRVTVLTVLFMMLATVSFAQGTAAPADARKVLMDLYANMGKNVSYEIATTINLPDGKTNNTTSKIYIKDDKNIRTETETPEMGKIVTVMTAAGAWNYIDKTKTLTEIPAGQNMSPQIPNEDFDVALRTEGADKIVDVVSKKDKTKTSTYYNSDKKVLTKTEIFGADGKIMMTTEYKNYVFARSTRSFSRNRATLRWPRRFPRFPRVLTRLRCPLQPKANSREQDLSNK